MGVRLGRSLEDLTVERHPGMTVEDASRLVVPLGANVEARLVAASVQEAVERQCVHVARVT